MSTISQASESQITELSEAMIDRPPSPEFNITALFDSFKSQITESLEQLSQKINAQLDDISHELIIRKNKHSLLQNNVLDLRQSLEFTHKELDEANAKITCMTQEKKRLESTIIEMKNDLAQRDKEVKDLYNKTYSKILNIERYTRDYNVRLVGIEETPKEDAKKVIAKYISKHALLGDQKQETDILKDIEIAHRTGKRPKNGHRHIIARFYSRPQRNDLLRMFRTVKDKSQQSLGYYFTADMPQEDYEMKRKARNQMKTAYENQQKVKFRKGQLIIEGKVIPIE